MVKSANVVIWVDFLFLVEIGGGPRFWICSIRKQKWELLLYIFKSSENFAEQDASLIFNLEQR